MLEPPAVELALPVVEFEPAFALLFVAVLFPFVPPLPAIACELAEVIGFVASEDHTVKNVVIECTTFRSWSRKSLKCSSSKGSSGKNSRIDMGMPTSSFFSSSVRSFGRGNFD